MSSSCNVWIYLTHACNLRCNYCYQAHVNKKMSISTATASINWAFAAAQENKSCKSLSFMFYGGEPLINKEAFFTSVNHAKILSKNTKIDVKFSILTNATLLTKKIFDFIVDNNIKMQISIDGSPENHNINRKTIYGKGSFDLIGGNLSLSQVAAYKNVVASLVVNPSNVHLFSESINYIVSLGFNTLIFHLALEKTNIWDNNIMDIFREEVQKVIHNNCIRVVNNKVLSNSYISPLNSMAEKHISWKNSSKDQLLDEDNNTICQAAKSDWTIDINGDIYPCSRIVDDVNLKSEANRYKLGNVHLGIWDYNNLNAFRSWLPRKDPEDQCAKCHWKYICPNQCYALFVGIDNNKGKPWPNICKTTDVMAESIEKYIINNSSI
ncbi:MAG: radical SAM protein [Parachlamydiaceae bacterium]|nr:radical SAM protein [Parachlamydiaceae bacterium]